MKRKNALTALCLLAVCGGLWLFFSRDKRSPNDSVVAESSEAASTNRSSFSPLKNRQTTQSVATQNVIKAVGVQNQHAGDPNDEWRVPINFYGKVEDEKGTAIADATIQFGWNNLGGSPSKQAKSDMQGFFKLEGEEGKYLEVLVSKSDYYSSKSNRHGFFYAGRNENFIGEPRNPIVFHLRGKGKAEPLLACDFPGFARIVQLRRDGTPTEINLAECRLATQRAGSFKLEFWGDKVERSTRKFNWKLRISISGGGLIETEEEFNFEAPESGYKLAIEIDMPSDTENWRTDFHRKFFIRLPDGKYGRIDFFLLARNGVYTVGSAINPSGSRNLEYDPAVQPKQTQFE